MSTKKVEDNLNKYVDPTGEYTNQELRLSEWYLRHKLLLQKIGTGCLIAWCVITVGYSLSYWLYYFSYGYSRDQLVLNKQGMEFQNYTKIQVAYQAKDLQLSDVRIFAGGVNKYDFVVRALNPNEKWLAVVDYKFSFYGGETKVGRTVILPGEERPFIIFGQSSDSLPAEAKFTIVNTSWQSIDAHLVPDPIKFTKERTNFKLENFKYTNPYNLAVGGIVNFDILNDTAYSYWGVDFYVEYLSNSDVVGFAYLPLEKFINKETRQISLKVLENWPAITEVRLYPVVNVFDSQAYLPNN